MERSGNDNKNVNYLDLNISIQPNKVLVSVYNKTDDFNFNVVSLTFPQSNIPLEVGYNVFYSQILRFGKICSEFESFICSLHKVFLKLIDRGYQHSNLIDIIKRCLRKNSIVFHRYNIMDEKVILDRIS